MYIAYFDETGDDGYPEYSSEIFVLSCIYMSQDDWKSNYDEIYRFRQILKKEYGLPIKQEFHTKNFITDKNPYHGKFLAETRRNILFQYCTLVTKLNIRVINVAIDKLKINRPKYNVLKNALTYAVQRIENDLNYQGQKEKFIIITDEGRIGKMRTTTREIQRINYIPSMYSTSSYRKEIKNLIEDPLPKRSEESYFIQLVDAISFIVHLYVKENLCHPKIPWGKRIHEVLSPGDDILLLNMMVEKINLKASRSNEFGVVYYPK